jgi:hypothetical protein
MHMDTRAVVVGRWSLLLLAAAWTPAFAAADAGGAPAAPVALQREAKSERRVLHLANGAVLRAVARPVGDASGTPALAEAWEVQVGGQWTTLPREQVLRSRAEKEALAEYGRLSKGLAEHDHVRRLALAGWLEKEGLYAELFRELDRVLVTDPDARGALELLRKPSLARTLPPADPDAAKERTRALREAGKAFPSQRELWIARLQSQTDREGLIELLQRELASDVAQRRDLAAHALRRVAPGRGLEALEPLALADRDRNAREEARRALRDARTPKVAERLVPRLASPSLKERIGAIDTLGIAGHAAGPAAIEPLITHLANLAKPQGGGGGGTVPRSHVSVRRQVAYVQDFNVEIAQAASIADPIVDFAEEGVVLDVAAATWQLPIRYESAVTHRALVRLTGEGAKRTPEEWADWWEANKPGKPGSGATPAKPPTPSGGGTTPPK